jgi:hypothetical protein
MLARHDWTLLGVALVAAAVGLYARSATVGLLSDDFALYDWAERGEFVPASWPYMRPVLLIAWSLLIPHLSLDSGAVALHLASAAAHGFNALLLHQVARILGLNRRAAVLGALIFVTSPTAVEAVAWPSAFSDVLLVTWTLGAILAATTLESTAISLAMAGSCSLLALLTKETAVALPLLYGVVSRLASQPRDRRRLVQSAAIAATLVVLYVAARAALNHWPTRPALTFAHIASAVRDPFVALTWPFHVNIRAPLGIDRVVWALSLLTLIALASRVHSLTQLTRLLGLGAVWVLALVAPTVGRFAITAELEGTRYLYAASAASALLLVTAASIDGARRARHAGLALSACVVLIGTAATVTWRHQGPWIAAAAARDAILPVIADLPAECDRAFIAGLPETIDGAHLARNGLPQALRLVYRRDFDLVSTPLDAAPHCRLDFASFSRR